MGALSFDVAECRDGVRVLAVDFAGFDATPCAVRPGSSTHVELTYVPDRAYPDARITATGTVVVPLALADVPAGELSGGREARTAFDLDIPLNVPITAFDLELRLLDANNATVFQVQVPFQVS